MGLPVAEVCRTSPRLGRYRQVRLSTFGRLRAAGFPVIPTFDAPHYTLALPDLSELTVARLVRCFDDPIPNPGFAHRGQPVRAEATMDIAVDFMDMTDEGRLCRMADVRDGFVPVAGRYAVVGCEDAEPAVAQIISVDIERGITLQVLDGSVEEHRHLLPTA